MELLEMKLLDVKDVLAIFNVGEKTFRTWIARKQVPLQDKMIVKMGNTTKIRKVVLEKWLAGDI